MATSFYASAVANPDLVGIAEVTDLFDRPPGLPTPSYAPAVSSAVEGFNRQASATVAAAYQVQTAGGARQTGMAVVGIFGVVGGVLAVV